jgi:hypothetical protein
VPVAVTPIKVAFGGVALPVARAVSQQLAATARSARVAVATVEPASGCRTRGVAATIAYHIRAASRVTIPVAVTLVKVTQLIPAVLIATPVGEHDGKATRGALLAVALVEATLWRATHRVADAVACHARVAQRAAELLLILDNGVKRGAGFALVPFH